MVYYNTHPSYILYNNPLPASATLHYEFSASLCACSECPAVVRIWCRGGLSCWKTSRCSPRALQCHLGGVVTGHVTVMRRDLLSLPMACKALEAAARTAEKSLLDRYLSWEAAEVAWIERGEGEGRMS